MRIADKISIPKVSASGGFDEDTYKVEQFENFAYVTDRSREDTYYWSKAKEKLANEMVEAFANFLHDNPECVEMDHHYEAEKARTLVRARIRLLRKE